MYRDLTTRNDFFWFILRFISSNIEESFFLDPFGERKVVVDCVIVKKVILGL